MSDKSKKNACVFCVYEDGATCNEYDLSITLNKEHSKNSAYIYGNQKKCSGFEVVPHMQEEWTKRFGGWF